MPVPRRAKRVDRVRRGPKPAKATRFPADNRSDRRRSPPPSQSDYLKIFSQSVVVIKPCGVLGCLREGISQDFEWCWGASDRRTSRTVRAAGWTRLTRLTRRTRRTAGPVSDRRTRGKVQSPKSKVQSPKSKVQSPKSKVQSPKPLHALHVLHVKKSGVHRLRLLFPQPVKKPTARSPGLPKRGVWRRFAPNRTGLGQ